MEFENLLTLRKTVSEAELTDFDDEDAGTRIRR